MLLALRNVRKQFRSNQALQDVTFQVDGRAVGLLGPNGAGKTTLMRICLGLLQADGGEVRVLGQDVVRDPFSVRARLGYAAEGPDRIPGLTGLESVAYAAQLCGVPRRIALLRAHEMLDLVGLEQARDRAVEDYSTGMHQRVKIAMAMVHDPDLLLLDEPTSGLDPGSRDELLQLIVRLRDGEGPAVLLSTHLLHDVERTCQACVIMHQGQVHFSGPLDQLRQPVSSEFEIRCGQDPLPLVNLLTQWGHQVAPSRRPGHLLVTMAPGYGAPALWLAASQSNTKIWHLKRRELTLEEAFLSTVEGRG